MCVGDFELYVMSLCVKDFECVFTASVTLSK